MEERRGTDRRARSRGGRRDGDAAKPWYLRRRLWLTVASIAFVAVRRVRGLGERRAHLHD